MDSQELKKRRKQLNKECEDRKHERKLLATEYENLQEVVKKCGIVCIVCLVLQSIVLTQFMKSDSVSVIGLGRYLTPFTLAVFFGSFVILLIKGFDLFLNANNKYSKMLAEKLEKVTASETLKNQNDIIMGLEEEIRKIDNELYEMGESLVEDELDETDKEDDYFVEPLKIKSTIQMNYLNANADKRNESFVKPIETVEPREEMHTITQTSSMISPVKNDRKKEDINDILSALDSFGEFGDEDEEEENSSELWKKDAMKRYSRY
ncbi:MAG: hypothetical protein IJA27_04790 [Lachnospiraceae bacterium]|nr:hypothetical protein [Lachnospiraceae bacterium]